MIKDKKYLENKGSQCLDLAKKFGATDCEVLVSNSIEETVSFRNKILDESNRSDSLVASITTFIGKKKSSIASSNLLDDNLKTLIERWELEEAQDDFDAIRHLGCQQRG